MKILINFSTLKKGGGQNVALNFLSALYQMDIKYDDFYFIVAKGSSILDFLRERKVENYSVFPYNPILRIFHEMFLAKKIFRENKIEIIYSYFGFGLFLTEIPQIVGAAASNLFYPEVNFWKDYRGISLLKRKIIDSYRLWGIYRAKGIIFENPDLEIRFHQLRKTNILTTTIKPSINVDYAQREYKLPTHIRTIKKGLFLCGWHKNKNILLIPKISFYIKKLNINFSFILTAPNDNSSLHKQFLNLVKKYDVEEYIEIVGPVKKEELKSLYSQMDIVFLLSQLESFSNNIIEAWTYRKVLMVTDASWSKSICGDAAIYVDRDNAEEIASKVKNILFDKKLFLFTVENGTTQLKKYPSIKEKTINELEFIKKVHESL